MQVQGLWSENEIIFFHNFFKILLWNIVCMYFYQISNIHDP